MGLYYFNIKLNENFESEITFTVIGKKRVVYSPTGPLNRDYDDVRRIADAVKAGVKKFYFYFYLIIGDVSYIMFTSFRREIFNINHVREIMSELVSDIISI